MRDGFPNVIGHDIPVKAPSQDEFVYVKNHFHPVKVQNHVQRICDGQTQLTHIVEGWPGSTHDSFILTTMVGNRLQAGIVSDGWLLVK